MRNPQLLSPTTAQRLHCLATLGHLRHAKPIIDRLYAHNIFPGIGYLELYAGRRRIQPHHLGKLLHHEQQLTRPRYQSKRSHATCPLKRKKGPMRRPFL